MIVADASALLEMLWRRPAGDRLNLRLRDSSDSVHVPHLTDLEVVNALRTLAAPGAGAGAASDALDRYRALRLWRHPHEPLIDRIWELRHNLSAYDASYVALAERLDAPLFTCDRRLARAPGHAARIELLLPSSM